MIGNDLATTIGGMQGNFQLNVRVPLIARNLISSMQLLTNATNLFADNCINGIRANTQRLTWLAENTLASATALNPIVGYDAATDIVEVAARTGVSLRDAALEGGIDNSVLSAALDPLRLARGNRAEEQD